MHDPRRAGRDPRRNRLELGAGGELRRELEQRLRALGLATLLLVQPRVHERHGRVACEHLEQAQLVLVELVETEFRDDDHTDDGGAVEQRHREQGLFDLVRARNEDADVGVRSIARQVRLTRSRDMPRDALADAGRRTSSADPDELRSPRKETTRRSSPSRTKTRQLW